MADVSTHALMQRPIKVYRSMIPGDNDYVAMIEGLHFTFRASGAFKAKKKAETWRQIEAEKLVHGSKKAARLQATREAAK
jgi:hypothetical protein